MVNLQGSARALRVAHLAALPVPVTYLPAEFVRPLGRILEETIGIPGQERWGIGLNEREYVASAGNRCCKGTADYSDLRVLT